MKINVGAIYSTKSEQYPRVRVISERGCNVRYVNKTRIRNGAEYIEKTEVYEPTGYCVQPVGTKTMAPVFFVDLEGVYDVKEGLYLVEQLTKPLQRYLLREELPNNENETLQ